MQISIQTQIPARTTATLRRKKSAKKQREDFTYAIGESSLGMVLAAFSAFGLVAVMTGKTPTQLVQRLGDRFPKIDLHAGGKSEAAALARLIKFIEKPRAARPDISLDMRGTPFQRRVWQEVAKIPAGKTATYSDIAAAIGSPKSMRAVGSACTNNLFAIIIPCHRVLRKGSDGLGKASPWQTRLLKREI